MTCKDGHCSMLPLSVTTKDLPDGQVGAPYQAQLEAAGGTGEYSWSLASGTLPAGVGLDATGKVGGKPTAAGKSTFQVKVKDGAGAEATADLDLVIHGAGLSITSK